MSEVGGWCGGDFAVEAGGEAGSTADDEGDGDLRNRQGLRCRGWLLMRIRIGFFQIVRARWEVACGRFGPGDGEGMRSPEADRGNAEVDMLTWLYSTRSWETDLDAQGVARKDFDVCAGHCAAGVAIEQRIEPE